MSQLLVNWIIFYRLVDEGRLWYLLVILELMNHLIEMLNLLLPFLQLLKQFERSLLGFLTFLLHLQQVVSAHFQIVLVLLFVGVQLLVGLPKFIQFCILVLLGAEQLL
jgi:hypothetical protein